MSKHILKRAAAVAAAGALVAVGSFMAVSPAQAAHIGGATFSPAAGGSQISPSISTDGPCPAASARVRARAFGFGFPASGQVIVAQTTVGFSTVSPMTLATSNTWQGYATTNAATALVGDYDVRVECTTTGGVVIDDFRNKMTWATPGNSYANIASATYTSAAVVPAQATTTTLTAAPVGNADEGTSVALTAAVAGTSSNPNAGTVEFFDGATSLGTSPVAAGLATKNVSSLPVGVRSLTAVYSGASGFDGSTSTALSYTINDVIISTTTTLAVSGTLEQFSPVTLDATVVPNNAVGSVVFKDGATVLSTKPVVSGAAQFVTSSLALGARSLTAEFVPTNPSDFSGSTSSAQSITIVVPSNPTAGQDVIVEVPVGALTISVGGDQSVTLNPVINATGSRFIGTATMDDVTVLDQRAGSKGWTVNGQLGAFAYAGALPAGATVVDNKDLGWTPAVRSTTGTQVVNASSVVTPGFEGSTTGLSVSRPLAVSPLGSSTGTAVVGADLKINAPTTIAPGTHTAVLTFTAI